MEEIWRPIKNHDGYFVSSLGRVKSTRRNRERILKIDCSQGKPRVTLYKGDKLNSCAVWSLVAQEFLDHVPNLREDIVISYLDNDPKNCQVNNLKLISAKENWRRICKQKYNYEIEVNSKEYQRVNYICKRENISRKEYFANIEKYNVSTRRKKHLNYELYSSDYHKNIWLKKVYGITLEEYNELLLSQNNVCAICGNEETTKGRHTSKLIGLSVDHCHNSKKIRGLLCGACNKSLGGFRDDISILKNAIEYLEKHKF